jgi:hypothetical protein
LVFAGSGKIANKFVGKHDVGLPIGLADLKIRRATIRPWSVVLDDLEAAFGETIGELGDASLLFFFPHRSYLSFLDGRRAHFLFHVSAQGRHR